MSSQATNDNKYSQSSSISSIDPIKAAEQVDWEAGVEAIKVKQITVPNYQEIVEKIGQEIVQDVQVVIEEKFTGLLNRLQQEPAVTILQQENHRLKQKEKLHQQSIDSLKSQLDAQAVHVNTLSEHYNFLVKNHNTILDEKLASDAKLAQAQKDSTNAAEKQKDAMLILSLVVRDQELSPKQYETLESLTGGHFLAQILRKKYSRHDEVAQVGHSSWHDDQHKQVQAGSPRIGSKRTSPVAQEGRKHRKSSPGHKIKSIATSVESETPEVEKELRFMMESKSQVQVEALSVEEVERMQSGTTPTATQTYFHQHRKDKHSREHSAEIE